MADLQKIGENGDLIWRWVQRMSSFGAHLEVIGISPVGEVVATGVAQEFDSRAPTREAAVIERLADAIAEADRDLELRRKDRPEETKPPAPDVATQRWLADSDDD